MERKKGRMMEGEMSEWKARRGREGESAQLGAYPIGARDDSSAEPILESVWV